MSQNSLHGCKVVDVIEEMRYKQTSNKKWQLKKGWEKPNFVVTAGKLRMS